MSIADDTIMNDTSIMKMKLMLKSNSKVGVFLYTQKSMWFFGFIML